MQYTEGATSGREGTIDSEVLFHPWHKDAFQVVNQVEQERLASARHSGSNEKERMVTKHSTRDHALDLNSTSGGWAHDISTNHDFSSSRGFQLLHDWE